MNTNRFGRRADYYISNFWTHTAKDRKTLLKWYVPYYIPAGILMTVFGVRRAKLSLASPISCERISLNRLLFSIYLIFFVTHKRTYSRKNIIKSVAVAVVVWFSSSFTPFVKLFLTFFCCFYFFFFISFCFNNVLCQYVCVCEWESTSLCWGHLTAQNRNTSHTRVQQWNLYAKTFRFSSTLFSFFSFK